MSTPDTGVIEAVLKRDRAIILAGLAAVTALSWLYLFDMARAMAIMDMKGMGGMAGAMTAISTWRTIDYVGTFTMWAVMMVGMMLPSAAPMILVFAAISRKKREANQPYVSTAWFAAGYVVAWAAFGAVATVLQGALNEFTLLNMNMESTSAVFGGALFLAAGIYQWTPWKQTCLIKCRSPLDFILNKWRDGSGGALRMGLEHGLYCVGCCWFLMALLFAGGVMNLLWVAAIAIFVMAEKVLPRGAWIANVSGGAMAAFGIFMLAREFAA